MRKVLLKSSQFCGLTNFDGKKESQRGYAKIKINKKKIDLSWVRSVVVATVARFNTTGKYTSKLKYPDNNDYYYWHNKEDWERFTSASGTQVTFVDDPNVYRVIIKKRYSDTYFYDKGKIVKKGH